MSTTQRWYTTAHALQAAFRACAANYETVVESVDWTDPYKPVTLPTAPTSYTTAGAPVGGSFYLREQATSEAARMIPSVELWVDSATQTQFTDSECTWYEVRIGVRVRVGSEVVTGTATSAAVAALHSRAIAACQVALVAAASYCRSAGLIYDATGALGVVWADIASPPIVDQSAPVTATAQSAAVADAVGYVTVTQRQYSPAGIGAVSL
jgi:hypothetical protein